MHAITTSECLLLVVTCWFVDRRIIEQKTFLASPVGISVAVGRWGAGAGDGGAVILSRLGSKALAMWVWLPTAFLSC